MSIYEQSVLDARKKFLKLNKSQEKEMLNLYKELAKKLQSDIATCRTKSQEKYLNNLHQIVELNIQDLKGELNKVIKTNIETSSQIASTTELAYYQAITDDVSLSAAFKGMVVNTSHETVKKLIQGQFYKDKTSLDQRLWNITDKSVKDIDTLIKVNVLRGANAKELAKQVEKYVNPLKKLEIKNDEVGFNKNVLYQASRLARTSITHSFRETQIQQAMDNPFNMGMKWELSPNHRVRMHGKTDICDDYANQNNYELGTGIFPADKMPVGHPQCLCITYQVNTDIRSAMKELKTWTNGGTNEKLDKWYERVERSNKEESKSNKEQVKANGKDGTIDIKVPKDKNNSENLYNTKYNNIIKNDFKPETTNINHKFKLSNIDWNNKLEINQENSKILNSVHTNLSKFMNDTNTEKLNIISLRNITIVKELTSGLEEKVIPDKEMLNILRKSEENELILTHNHPGETTFSSGDISFILRYKSINALTLECSNGMKYIMQRGTLKSSMLKEYNFINVYRKIFDNLKKKYPKSVDEDENVWNKFLHEVNIEVAKKYDIKYSRIEE